MNLSNIEHVEDAVMDSNIFQDVSSTNDLPHLLHVETNQTIKMFYHKLCNLEHRKRPSEISYDSDYDFRELKDMRLDNNEGTSSDVHELNEHEVDADLVKFKTFVENNIVKLKDRLAMEPKMSRISA